MRKKVHKFFCNFEKEEKWINEMAVKGLNLVGYTFATYYFEKGEPGEYIYRIELLENVPSHPESEAYIDFMKETGVECVDTYFRWVFFRKKSSEGTFNLYSDLDSKIQHYKRVIMLVGIVTVLNFYVGVNYILNNLGNNNNSFFSWVGLLNIALFLLLAPMLIGFIRKVIRLKRQKDIYG